MIYYTVMLRRRSDLTHEDFVRVWLGEHLPLANRLPGLIEARFMPRAEGVAPAAEEPPDGLGVLVFASVADLEAALATPAAVELRLHTSTFADSDAAVRLVAQDQP
jgi:uncharacterized protein (TIGR02118 family)